MLDDTHCENNGESHGVTDWRGREKGVRKKRKRKNETDVRQTRNSDAPVVN